MNELSTWRAQFAADIVGESETILEALRLVRRAAATDLGILITGETGTGKELFARAAHRASHRCGKPFIAVNCAAIPEQLFESELFGHARGAFTGAAGSRSGRFVAADGGTIFLDEIGDLPLAAQAKLLRVLEHGTVSPLGADSETSVNVRVIAATHRNLEDMVAAGKFRADLYFRLAVVGVELPALRDRPEDFERLVEVAIASANRRTGYQVAGIEDDALDAMRAYAWPGNVRELVHRMERAVVLAGRGMIGCAELKLPVARATAPRGVPMLVSLPMQPAPAALAEGTRVRDFAEGSQEIHLPPVELTSRAGGERHLDLRNALEVLERRLIGEALEKSGGNRTMAAALLGLNRTTLAEKLRRFG